MSYLFLKERAINNTHTRMMSFNRTTSLGVGLGGRRTEEEIFLLSFIAAALCLGVIASLAIAFFLLSWLLCSLVETRRNAAVHRASMEDDPLHAAREEVEYDDVEAEPRPPVPPPRPTSERFFPPHLTVLLSWHRRGFVTSDPSCVPGAAEEAWLWGGRS
ncbi:hypothetical protein C7M84_010159 [Penaeus vannamei]|uniref:Uncharacterized protein n=1 Tax=Penaeus vannamei TaxID=6689 RepID=A0A3R7MWR9_PENVA|nr:uncharacterized protein LOC113812059 [Penaeus vannamei]ROT71505.1 hypothetical protein C7M84_010159 [Penaeus vannamei]